MTVERREESAAQGGHLALERIEPPVHEQIGWSVLEGGFARRAALDTRRENLPRPDPASRLARADALNTYNPPSYQVKQCIGLSADMLRSLQRYIQDLKELPMLALYPLIRASVEATSVGLWVLDSGRREKLAWRSLQLAWSDNENFSVFERSVEPESTAHERHRQAAARLREIRSQLGNYRTHDLSSLPSVTTIVGASARSNPGRPRRLGALEVWRACSGMAHGNSPMMQSLLERKVTGFDGERGVEFMLTSRVSAMAVFFDVAVEQAETLTDVYVAACEPPRRKSG